MYKRIIMFLISILIIPFETFAKDNLTIMPISSSSWGDSALIESNGEYLLMDVTSVDISNPCDIIDFLIENNVKKFDIYLSHYHYDHYGYRFVSPDGSKVNLIEYLLLNENLGGYKNYVYDIGTLYLPDVISKPEYCEGMQEKCESLNEIEQGFVSAAKKNNIEVKKLNVGDTFNVGSTKAKVLHLETDSSIINNLNMSIGSFINNSSLVTMFTNGKTRFLSAGDIEEYTENNLVKLGVDISADIFKLNHHGLQTSTEISNTSKFIEKVKPKYSYFQFHNKDFESSEYTYTYSSISTSINNLTKFSNLYTSQINKKIKFIVEDDIIIPYAKEKVYSITINYVDKVKKNTIAQRIYYFSYDFYNNPIEYHLYDYEREFNGYTYNTSEINETSGVLSEDKVYNIYYTKNIINNPIEDEENSEIVKDPSAVSFDSIIMYLFIIILLLGGCGLLYYNHNKRNN